MIVRTPAIVLKSFPYGDTSIIAKCFSKDNGKISLIVKGARKKKSLKDSQFQPLSYIDLIYNYKSKRNIHTVSKVEFIEYWSNILDDLRSITLSMAILEITDKTLSESDPNPKLFSILIKTLQSYNKRQTNPNLLFWFYECTLLTQLGFQPNLDQRELPGLILPDPNSGPNSGMILASLLAGDINKLPKEDITKLDRKIISEYLWLLLCYHFDDLLKTKSIKVVREILC